MSAVDAGVVREIARDLVEAAPFTPRSTMWRPTC
jgi:hypothetical protein